MQGSVSGAYTISCLTHHNLSNSSESLITCMVKVSPLAAMRSEQLRHACTDWPP